MRPTYSIFGRPAAFAARFLDLHRVAVGELPHRVERPRDDAVTFAQAREHLEIAFAGDADLDRHEHRSPLADDEHPFCFLARLSGRRLGGRHAGLDRGGATSAARGRRLVNEIARLVEEHLPYGESLNRDRYRLRASGRRDLGGAREAGTHVRHLLFERDHDLEIGCLPLPRGLRPRLLNRTVADLGDLAPERLVMHRVDGDLGRLVEHDGWDVRFVDLYLRFDHRHVGNRQQHRAGIVHRPDDDVLALLDVATGHDAIHRGGDDDLAQVVARGLELSLLLQDLLLARLNVLHA